MPWFAEHRRKKLQKTVRDVSGTKDEASMRLSILDDEHLSALATVATRAKADGKAAAFRIILRELVAHKPAAVTVAEAPEELFPTELDRFVVLRASRVLNTVMMQAVEALPSGTELAEAAATRTVVDLLRYGVEEEKIGSALADTIRKQPYSFVREPEADGAEA